MQGVGLGAPGPLTGLAHKVFLKFLKAKRKVPTAAQRQEVLAVQQGLRALCGCTVMQSACELNHVAPVRQLFADSVQRLQALCVDCHSEKTLRKSAQPTSLESRVCSRVMEAYVRSPKLPPLVFEAQGSHREKPYVGVDVVRCRRGCYSNRLVTGIGLTCYACKASNELVKHQTGLWTHQTGLFEHQTGLFKHQTGLFKHQAGCIRLACVQHRTAPVVRR